ncbi:hypothetical protein ASPWEDRAFT_39559 [Aspergillus wentii DTO 134E9]|uniref:Uncharacterized protein n=1 Tax=Aspergillus wentii DTO 134E9 TaxID=1073089 RepID=A0A1L9RSM6_ASPWE|nr:uncharacterized protein ASPWEDRAFT_39559 [Aspergillus wentii DTO 134E9]OJJ37817.1 hypothetical protein ASPWEDRAFT_39559 [Aspergillus wentii DTO 134E9]
MIAAAVMLYRSDGRPQSEWPVSPAVILAVCSAVGTTSLEMARSEGATISWWTRSLQGCTLRDLHCQWAISTGIWSSLLFWRQFSRNTLATIGVTLCLVVSPLLQRASVSDSARFSSPATVHLPAASTHSSYTTGASKSDEALDWSLDYAAVISEYLDRSPITTSPIHGCNEGTCTGNLTTVGITGSCPIHNTTTVDLVEELLIGEQSPHTKPKPSVMEIAVNFDNLGLDMSPWHGLFFIDATYFVPSHNHTVLRFSNGTSFFGCPGTMVTKRCSITPGLVEYPVSISNGSLTIRNEITGFFPSVSDSSFLGPNKTRTGRGKPIYDANSIGGILTAAKYIFDSQITISAMVETMLTNHTRDVTVQPTFTGRMAARYMQLPSWGTQSCVINMPDPTSGILSVLNGLMFRTGLAVWFIESSGSFLPWPLPLWCCVSSW